MIIQKKGDEVTHCLNEGGASCTHRIHKVQADRSPHVSVLPLTPQQAVALLFSISTWISISDTIHCSKWLRHHFSVQRAILLDGGC